MSYYKSTSKIRKMFTPIEVVVCYYCGLGSQKPLNVERDENSKRILTDEGKTLYFHKDCKEKAIKEGKIYTKEELLHSINKRESMLPAMNDEFVRKSLENFNPNAVSGDSSINSNPTIAMELR